MKRLLFGITWNFLFVFSIPGFHLTDLRSEIPDGQWLSGKFPIKNWWTYNGAAAGETSDHPSMAFHFLSNGEAEFFMTIKTVKGKCLAEELVYKKGRVVPDSRNSAFIFYPLEGNYRNFYSCSPSLNVNRSTIGDEMHPVKFYWGMKKDKKGQQLLGIRFDPDPASAVTYFHHVSW
jgi:hypothetical protein